VKNGLWRRARAVPSLDLRFATTKSLVDATTGAQLVTFTRASSATFVGSDGVIRTAVTNLLLRSEEFDNASWVKTRTSVTANAIAAPNGTLTADKIVEDNSSNTHLVTQGTPVAGLACVYSFYAKAAERSRLTFTGGGFGAQGFAVTFDFGSGTIPVNTGNKASIAAMGDGWYRASVAFTPSNTVAFELYLDNGTTNNYTGDGTSGIFLWGAQLEQSSAVGEYIPTTSTINSAPRFDHNPTTGESLGLLVEEQRTNLVLRSEEFDNASWSKANSTVTANAVTAPDNLSTADKIVVNNGASGFDAVLQGVTITANAVTTLSGFFKAAEYTAVRIQNSQSGNGYIAVYNLSTGALISQGAIGTGTIVGHGIQAFPGGWYRIWVSGTITSGATNAAWRIQISDTSGAAVTGDGTSGIYIWGAQLEAGAFPTSYIPTTTATVTRSADVASISGSNFSTWYRQDEGTVFTDAAVPYTVPALSFPVVAGLNDGTANNKIVNGYLTSLVAGFEVSTGGAGQAGVYPSIAAANRRFASCYRLNDFAASVNGGAIGTDTSGTVPTVDRLGINAVVGYNALNGHIRRLTYWPTRLPNSTLQAVTL
jgi:hypothetical protein